MNTTAKVENAFTADITRALKHRLTDFGEFRVDVENTVDHDGDPVVMLRVLFPHELEKTIDWDVRKKMRWDIWRIVDKYNIDRFPHLVITTEDAFKRSA